MQLSGSVLHYILIKNTFKIPFPDDGCRDREDITVFVEINFVQGKNYTKNNIYFFSNVFLIHIHPSLYSN